MGEFLDQELRRIADLPPVSPSDLAMMHWMGLQREFLDLFSAGHDVGEISARLRALRREASNPNIYGNEIHNVARRQFGDRPAAVRELCQNAVDSYLLSDVSRDVRFTIRKDGEHTVVSVRDEGVGMSLRDIVEYVLVPFNTTKGENPNKIGEHGIGWWSITSVSDLVKIRSKKRESTRSAVAVIRPGNPSIEAFLGEEESEDAPGTEVTLFIPHAVEQLNPQGIMRQLWKYVGYLDPKQSRIFLNNELVNSLAREYLSGVSVDVAVNGSATPLVFSFSKRALRKDFSDERFDDRNQNLQHIVYTHSGLFVKYGSNPFDPRTIYGQLFNDLISNGLDFWIQLPRNVGLISGRYDIDSSHANQVLDASYDAFRSLVLDSILGDEQILYHESQALQKGIAQMLQREYVQRAKDARERETSLRKRIATRLVRAISVIATGAYKAGVFAITIPFKLLYGVAMVPISLASAGVNAVRQQGYKCVGGALAAVTLAGGLLVGAREIYRHAYQPSKRIVQEVYQDAERGMNQAAEMAKRYAQPEDPAPQEPPARAVSPPENPIAQPRDAVPATEASVPPAPEQSKPGGGDEKLAKKPESPAASQASAVSHPEMQAPSSTSDGKGVNAPSLIDQSDSWWQNYRVKMHAAYRSVTSFIHDRQPMLDGLLMAASGVRGGLEEKLGFLPLEYRGRAADTLFSLGLFIGLTSIASAGLYLTRRGLRAVGIEPRRVAYAAGKAVMAPFYPIFWLGGEVGSLVQNAVQLYEKRIGLYRDVELRRERLLQQRRQQIIKRRMSQVEQREFIRDAIEKKIIKATLCQRLSSDPFDASVHGSDVRISIAELIDLYMRNRIKYAGRFLDRPRIGDYVIDQSHLIVKEVIALMEPAKRELDQRYDPRVFEDRLDAIKAVLGGTTKFLYLVSGLGLLHVGLNAAFPSIHHPYENSELFQETARVLRKAARGVGVFLEYAAKMPYYILLVGGYAAYYLARGLFYEVPRYTYRGAVWTVREVGFPLLGVLAKIPDSYKEYNSPERRAQRARAKELALQQHVLDRQRRAEARLQRVSALAQQQAQRLAAKEQERAATEERERREREEEVQRKEARQRDLELRGGYLGVMGTAISDAFKSFGVGFARLITGDRDHAVPCEFDEANLIRVVEYTGVGQSYLRYLHAAQRLDALLSDTLGLAPLKLRYSYPECRERCLMGGAEGGKRPVLHLSIKNATLQHHIRQLGRDPALSFTMLEVILHHKTHQSLNSVGSFRCSSSKEFYLRKEELRRKIYMHVRAGGRTVEQCVKEYLDELLAPARGPENVDADYLARLSRMRTIGLMTEAKRRKSASPKA